MLGSLLICMSVVWAGGAAGQETPATEVPLSEAERIAKLRDLAAKKDADAEVAKPVVDQSPVKSDDSAADKPVAQDRPIPEIENQRLGTSEPGLFGGAADKDKASSLGDGWLLSTLAALGVVLALVFGIRWLLRRGGIVTKLAPQGSVVEVLSRTTVAPRSHVLLMRVGQRILVVSDSSAGMRTLASVQDPEEFSELLGAVDASKPASMSKSFNGVMKKLSGQWSDSDEAEFEGENDIDAMADGVGMDKTRSAITSVRGRLAALSGVGGKS